MAKPDFVELPGCEPIPILYEDRSVLAVDKPRGSKLLHYAHRLDVDTSGVLLFAKSPGAVEPCPKLFEGRRMDKTYLAVASGQPLDGEWTCQLKLAPDPKQVGRIKVDARHGKPAETRFRLLKRHENCSLIEVRPITGRTHQNAFGNPGTDGEFLEGVWFYSSIVAANVSSL